MAQSRIHGNTAKKARKLGIELTVVVDDIVASKDGVTLASHPQATVALDQAIARLNGSVTGKPGSRAKLAAAFATIPVPVRTRDEDEEELDDEETDQEDEEAGDEGEVEGDEGEEEGGDEGRSIVKRKYKDRYQPTHNRCGDDLAERVTAHVTSLNADGDEYMDIEKLARFAKANDCWQDSYRRLNPGQMRMNVGNRLRAKVRRDPEFKVIWA